jgi:branched-chain amino acid transport system permease protein
LGIALIISEGVKIFWGTDSLAVKIPDVLKGTWTGAGLEMPVHRMFVIVLSSVVLGIMAWILFKTKLGIIIRAAVSDSEMADALGINMPRISTLVFGVGTWMAGVAGVAISLYLTIYPGLAEQMALESFVVVVVGGFGSLLGALVTSLILGELHSFGIQFIPRLAPVLMFAFMAIILALRPMGLFGDRR